MSTDTIKRCPFCGGEAELDCDDHFSNWFVRCTKCFCKTPKHTTEFLAKVCWNTRKPMERIMERLEECKETHDRRLLSKKETASFKIKELQFSRCYQNAIEIVKEEGGGE